MLSVTFGLPLRHPAIILSGIALILDIVYEITTSFVISIPADQHPYHRVLLGWLAMYGMSSYCFYASDSVFGEIIGYAMTALSVVGGLFFTLIWIAYAYGPDSVIWNLVLTTGP